MADEGSNKGLPIPHITAVWSGMSPADIEAGIAAGSILRSARAPQGALPDAAAFGSIAQGLRSASAGIAAAPGSGSTAAATTDGAAPGADYGVATTTVTGSAVDVRKQLEGWLRALDPDLTEGTADAVWTYAGATDAERATTLRRYLGETLLGDADAGDAALDEFMLDPSHRARVVDLHGMTGADLAQLAAGDIGYRHALATMQPLALTGNRALFAQANGDGALDRFDPDTGEQLMSDAWLADRAKLLAWTAASDASAIAGNEDWTFVDRTSSDADGNPSTFELVTGNADAGKNQVVFGNASDEFLQGVGGSDRMYGGAGADILRGAGGGDHLEGGRGDDLLLGGAGDDELAGDQGADELEGGRGNDRLAAGSGNDTLAGGRGNDRLEGGTGIDTYVIDAGDGADVIVDADGAGVVELDGAQIAGTMAASGQGSWASADGRLDLSFAGGSGSDADSAGTLTIRAYGDASDHGGTPANIVTVRNWKNGDLGITLADTPVASSTAGPNFDLSSITGPEVPVLSAEDLQADLATGEAGNAEQADAGTDVTADIAWGDVAPVGVGNGAPSSASPVGEAAASGAAADALAAVSGAGVAASGDPAPDSAMADAAPDGAASAGIDGASTGNETAFDPAFADALAAIFGPSPAALTALDPARVESAIQAFSGVLEVPDVSAAAGFAPTDGVNALTPYDYADALAGDFADGDIGNEAGMLMQLPLVPDVRSSELAGAAGQSVFQLRQVS